VVCTVASNLYGKYSFPVEKYKELNGSYTTESGFITLYLQAVCVKSNETVHIVLCVRHPVPLLKQSSPVTGPEGFQEVKVPRFRDNTGLW